jgi:hypothetical protein
MRGLNKFSLSIMDKSLFLMNPNVFTLSEPME